uniref:chitinase n=1 Tax=Phallusia mammillata TaxID=59560 RepID=A0A6F9D9N0_9ASCI|nr:calcium-activated chloride channel regulator 4-like [Phallusia mammillata]
MYGPKDKTFVHEWAHLRWGIFDETATNGYEDYYYDANGVIQYTRSPASVLGENYVVDFESGEVSTCQYKQETNWLPLDGCIFIPFENQKDGVHSSIMSFQYHNDLFTFDHDDESDPQNLHDKDAPNEHNLLCNQRSEWGVISSSEDFAGDNNPANDAVLDVTPYFNIVQPLPYRIVLAFDISSSMSDKHQFSNMKNAASMFIKQFVPTDSYMGMVQFEVEASDLVDGLVLLENDQARESLVANFPTGTKSKTCIGCGLRQALQAFGVSAGGEIIIMTDGLENTAPYVKDVADSILLRSVAVNAVFYGEASNPDLEQLVKDSGGVMYVVNASDPSTIVSAFKSLAETNDGNLNTDLYQVFDQKYTIPSHGTKKGEVVIDSTIGESTTFSFVWSDYWIAPTIFITDPVGNSYGNNDAVIDVDHKTVFFKIPGIAMSGVWEFMIATGSNFETVAVVATSKASNSDLLPINVQSTMTLVDDTSESPTILYSKVSRGYEAILGAQVQATINHPDGTVSTIDLFDNGAAPDIRSNDGVYSRYFSEYTDSGKFSVQIKAVGLGNVSETLSVKTKRRGSSAAVNYGYVKDDGSVVLNTNLPQQIPPLTTKDIEPFQRVTTLGSFHHDKSVSNFYNDIIPPNRVIDLKAIQVDMLDANQGIQITFTAPGDDNAVGTATQYEIRYTYGSTSDLLTSFDDAELVTDVMVTQGDIDYPLRAYWPEVMVVKLPDIPADVEMATVGIAMRATDDAGNAADVSNVAVLNLFLSPPAISCTDAEGNPESSYPFEKNGDCLRFYQCASGELKTKDCAYGAVFDPTYNVCVHPSLVPDCADAYSN